MQHLAGRYVLHYLDPKLPLNDIVQEKQRKPFLADTPHEFSISHCDDYAAAIVSTNKRVGMDIETVKPVILRLAHKFLTPAEQALLLQHLPNELQAFTLGWSIKESLFKWYSVPGIDFKAHLHIHSLHWDTDHFLITCRIDKEASIEIIARGFFINGLAIVWVIG